MKSDTVVLDFFFKIKSDFLINVDKQKKSSQVFLKNTEAWRRTNVHNDSNKSNLPFVSLDHILLQKIKMNQ